MARFQLTHHVIRAGRDISNEVTEHATREGAERSATLAAEFTTVGSWRQEIVDAATSDRWLRTHGIGWSRVPSP